MYVFATSNTYGLPQAGQSSKSVHIVSQFLHSSPGVNAMSHPHFIKKDGKESIFPQVVQLANSEARIWTKAFWLQDLNWNQTLFETDWVPETGYVYV